MWRRYTWCRPPGERRATVFGRAVWELVGLGGACVGAGDEGGEATGGDGCAEGGEGDGGLRVSGGDADHCRDDAGCDERGTCSDCLR